VVYSTGRPIAQHPDNKIHPEAGTRPLLHHEEFLFRRIHQSIEILFSQVIHDLTLARDLLGDRAPDGTTRRQPHHVPEADIPRIIDLVDRSTLIMRHLRGHLDILGTMTPQQFLVFRDQLQPASGFQSTQFIEIELLLGLRHNDLLPRVPKDTFPPQMERFLAGLQDRLTPKEATELAELRRVGPRERLIQKLNGMYIERFSKEQLEAMQEQVNKQSLVQALEDWLERTPVERAYPDFVRKFVSVVAESQESSLRGIENAEAKKQRAAAHLTSLCDFLGYDRTTDTLHATPEYRMNRALLFIIQFSNEPLLAAPNKLIDSIMQFDTSVREFRYAHARLVELQLGRKVGGTGSDGVTYLDETAPQTAVGRLTMARTFGVNPYILGDRPPSFQELAFRIDQEAEAATLDPYAGDHPARK
jgi:tryptophan 2,3-dioxygenase